MIFVKRNKPNVTVIKGVPFYPGENLISDSDYELVKNHWGFKSEVDCGNMNLKGHVETSNSNAVDFAKDTTKEKLSKRAASLSQEVQSLSVKEAKVILASCNDPVLLQRIQRDDPRAGIQKTVQERLSDIRNQKGSDTSTESVSAPLGDGSDFSENEKLTIDGKKAHSAIPALKG